MLKWVFFVLRFSYGKYPVDTSTEGLQLVVREEELEQSTGEHSPGVSLPGNSGLLSTFQDIRCFYHWNCSLDDLKKWCGNCRSDGSSLCVLYVCCDRNKDPNYIIAVVNVLEDSDLPSRSLKLGTFEVFYILKNLTFKVFEVHCVCVCVFWWIFKGSIFALSMCHPFRFWLHRTRCFCPAITWHEREKWQLRSLEKKHVGSWWGWMDEYTSWVQHREDTGHHDNHDYHEHVWSIRMLQNFYPRCFGVLNIWVSFWRKRQTTKSVSSRMCSRVQPKAFVGFKATLSSHPTCHGKIVSRTTWLWDEKTCSL